MIVASSIAPWQRPRLFVSLLGLASAACLGAAFWLQYMAGLEPCPLCIDQRWAHGTSIAIAAVSLVVMTPPRTPIVLAALAVSFLAGTAIAAWHVMVEWHWVASPGCSTPEFQELSIDSLLTTDVVRCDEVVWSLAGVSMAGWNALVSFMLAAVAVTGAVASLRG